MDFTDRDSSKLLELLARYASEFSPDLPQTFSALAADLVESQDSPTKADLDNCGVIVTVKGWN